MKRNFFINVLLVLLVFLGIGAIIGGSALVISPSGKLLGNLPISILAHSPFHDFFFPGLILFLVLGISPCLVAVALIYKPKSKFAERFNIFKDMHWAWTFCIYIAFALIIWIQVETIFVQSVGWLQTFYMLYAIPMLVVALLPSIRKSYSNE